MAQSNIGTQSNVSALDGVEALIFDVFGTKFEEEKVTDVLRNGS
jgi:hypothetical protein